MSSVSIVEYFSDHSGYRCGYCKSPDGNYSRGMWAFKLTPLDYQHLIDRGWRRSGQYCYKPHMTMTCCPHYTIRCEAMKFQPTRSQKKLLKRVHKFLAYGKLKDTNTHQTEKPEADDSVGDNFSDYPDSAVLRQVATKCEKDLQNKLIEGVLVAGDINKCIEETNVSSDFKDEYKPSESVKSENSKSSKSTCTTNSGIGADPDKPPSKKAKILRKERKLKKLMEKATKEGRHCDNIEELLNKNQQKQKVKSIEDFLNEPLPKNPAHNLKIRLVRSGRHHEEFGKTFSSSYSIYKKYQMTIHKDPPDKCSDGQFTRFLVKSPLQADSTSGSFPGFGSFHQQYWLDDRLIAVGVIDILPYCVSSVYLYYDPEFSFLSLGTYAALREIAFTRQLHRYIKELKYYYMGFYIHSCPKMKYKGQFFPSYLLCPETYGWFPIEVCRPKLDISKYCRFEDDVKKEDQDGIVDLNEVQILHSRQSMPYAVYLLIKRDNSENKEVSEYARLVGKKCYSTMLLYRA